MMASQILKSMDFTKTQKSRYLENETSCFLQIKKFTSYTSRATLLSKIERNNSLIRQGKTARLLKGGEIADLPFWETQFSISQKS